MKYTAQELAALFGVTIDTISQYKNGRNVRRNGRVEWAAPPLLEASDYEQVIENGRAKTYYFDSAVQKIRAKREGKETAKTA